MSRGIDALLIEIDEQKTKLPERADYFDAMKISLNSAVILAERYADIARNWPRMKMMKSEKMNFN